jgi:hypothetical protein
VLLGQLPVSSAFRRAQADDPEYAAAAAAMPSRKYHPPLSEWSLEAARLSDLTEQLSQVIGLLVVLNGGKPGTPYRAPRPFTAVDRLESEERVSRHDSLVAEVRAAQERYAQMRGETDG